MLELIVMAEMNGWDYSDRALPDGLGSRLDAPDAWERYQRQCWADAGLGGINSVAPGSGLVDLVSLPDEGLRRLVAVELARGEVDVAVLAAADVEQHVSPIAGGLAVRVEGAIVVEPGCCCDLGEITEWERAVDAPEWQDIWVGHDVHRLAVRHADGGHRVRWGRWGHDEWTGEAVCPTDELPQQLARARQTLERLAARIESLLPPDAELPLRSRLARRLAGL